jgi:hypothetical protein
LLCVFLVVVLVEESGWRCGLSWSERQSASLPPARIAAVTAASAVATLLSPYSYRLFGAAAKSVGGSVYSAAAHAMSFREPQHYVLLLLTMAAFLALGCRRSRDLFQITLLIASVAISFRMQGDAWAVVLSSVAIIANGFPSDARAVESEGNARPWKWEKLATAGLVALVLGAALIHIPPREVLQNRIGENFPTRACDYIRKSHLPTPLFNSYNWGGFLTWYLPEYPVAIDGRTELYGDEIVERYFDVVSGQIPLNSDPSFAGARTILLEQSSAMAEAMATTPGFKVVFHDDVALVLVQQN